MDAADWDRRYAESDLVWSAGPNQWLAAEVDDLPAGRALDLAAGEGRNALWLAARGWQVTAVDFSREGLSKLRRRAEDEGVDVQAVCADVLQYEPAASFDLVVVLYLQLPPDQRAQANRRAARAVGPGGTLLVVGHDSTNLSEGYGGPPDPAVLFTPADVAGDIDGLGLVVDKAQRVQRTVPTDDGPRVALDALVRARRRAPDVLDS